MIKSISVSNFKSFKEATLKLTQLTMMIGPNASGKSNALEAFRLLSMLAKGQRLDDISRQTASPHSELRGRVQDLFLLENEDMTLSCVIELQRNQQFEIKIKLGMQNGIMVLKAEQLSVLNPKHTLYSTLPATKPDTKELMVKCASLNSAPTVIKCSNLLAVFYQLLDHTKLKNQDDSSQILIPEISTFFKDLLDSILFLDPLPSAMRGYSFVNDNLLKNDASNLSSVLFDVCQLPEEKAMLLDLIKSLPEQDICDIDFIITERGDIMVKLTESFGGKQKTFDATMLSDGTLRVLAIGAALLNAERGSLVIIEEIDNGVHPSRAQQLVSGIKLIARHRGLQVLISSHNPALVDALPEEDMGDLICCYRHPSTGYSQITRLADLESYPELISQGSLGYLMNRQIIEKYLKDNTSAKVKKQKALNWLEQFKED